LKWGKLCSISTTRSNALGDLPLRRNSRSGRGGCLFATKMADGTDGDQSGGISRCRRRRIPASWTPPLLRLPDAILELLLGRTMKIDPEARSSMWEDLQRGRATKSIICKG